MTARRHAELVLKRAGKGCKRCAFRALRKVVHEAMRRQMPINQRSPA